MIHKEDIDKELNESEAIIKQQQVKIEETKKYTETLNTCTNVLNQIKELSGVITENQKILNDNMVACGNLFDKFAKTIETETDKTNTIISEFKNKLDNTSTDIKKVIHNEISENIQAEIIQIGNNTKEFSNNLKTYKTSIDEIVKKTTEELENNRKEYKKQMEKETYRVIFDNKILFFFFIIFLMIPVLYCINWQFNCIPFMQQIETPDIIKYIIIFFTGFIISIPIKAIIRYIFDK